MKRLISTMIMVLIITSIVGVSIPAQLVKEEIQPKPSLKCELDYLKNTRVFAANATLMNLGLVCGANAHVLVYECVNNDCKNIIMRTEGYKNNNKLSSWTGFVVDDKYYYKCLECPDTTGKCPISVVEGEKVEVEWFTADPDTDVGPQKKLTTTFDGKLDASGFWQTQKGDAGIHNVKATVNDGEFEDTTSFCIEVIKSNTPPKVIAQDVTATEGDTVKLDAKCTDVDGDKTTISYSGWMTSDTKVTDYDSAGKYKVEIVCKDPDGSTDSKEVIVTVNNKNRNPVLITAAVVSVKEGETVKLTPECTDPDGDKTVISYNGWMTTNTKKTGLDDAGTYDDVIQCKDPIGAIDTKNVKINVADVNQDPVISELKSEVTVYEGETVTLSPKCVDPDGDTISIKFSGWMTQNTKSTGYEDAGDYSVKVTCADSKGRSDEESVTVHVLNRNRPPTIAWRKK